MRVYATAPKDDLYKPNQDIEITSGKNIHRSKPETKQHSSNSRKQVVNRPETKQPTKYYFQNNSKQGEANKSQVQQAPGRSKLICTRNKEFSAS